MRAGFSFYFAALALARPDGLGRQLAVLRLAGKVGHDNLAGFERGDANGRTAQRTGGYLLASYRSRSRLSALAAVIGRGQLTGLGLAAAAGHRGNGVSDECLARCALISDTG